MPSDNNPSRDPNLSPVEKQVKSFSQQYALAVELPFVLAGTIFLGGLLGFFLDRWLHTKPLLMIVLGLVGFIAGLREVLRRLPTN
jgi:F0F1-type ATP synthase assembly protein I